MNDAIQQNSNLSSFYSVPLLQTKITQIVKKVWKVRQIDEKKQMMMKGFGSPLNFQFLGNSAAAALAESTTKGNWLNVGSWAS